MIVRPLTEYCTLNMGQSPDSKTYNTQGKGLPFYQGNADFGETHPITHVWCSAPVKVAEDGDILISVRAPIGAMNMAVERCCIGRGLAALTPIRNKCSKQFLYYALQSKVDALIAQGTGSTFKAISKKVLEATCIPAYSTIEQEQIAETIGHVDNTISARRKQLALLDQLVKSRFIELFGEPLSNQKGWQTMSIVEAAPIKSQRGNLADEVWLLNLDAVEAQTGTVLFKHRVQSGEINASTVYFTAESVLFSKLRPYLNKVVMPDEDGVATSEMIPMCPLADRLNRAYLCYWLRSDAFVRHISEKVAGAKMPRVSMDYFRSLAIEMPPLELQEQFAAFVEQTDKSKYYSSLSFRYCQAAANTYRLEWMTCRTSDF